MMKKIILFGTIFVLLFYAFAPVAAFSGCRGVTVFGVEPNEAEGEVEAAEKEPVDYYLAYPGILPDHFLYPIKMLRDRILLFLTTDPLKKAELFLLFADKRIGAAKSLVEGGKEKLGVTTATQAEKYLEKAVEQEKVAAERNTDTFAFLEKLAKATQKHEEVMVQIQERVTEQARETIQESLQYSRQGQEQVRQRIGQ